MIVVSDTSPLSNFMVVNRLHLLKELYGEIIIPEAVMRELLELEKRSIDLSFIKNSAWIKVLPVQDEKGIQALLKEVDLGEAEAILLAKQLKADWLLMDETKGRRIAETEGLHIIGLLGTLLLAKKQGLLKEIKSILDEIISKAKLRVSKELYERVMTLAGE